MRFIKKNNPLKPWPVWIALSLMLLASKPMLAQHEKVVDEIVGVVGSHPVYWSDIEGKYAQARAQGMKGNANEAKCRIFEQEMFQKLLINQAEIDSLSVTDEQVESELDRRLQYYVQQFGSQKKLEEYYDKSISEFKDELRDPLKEEMLAQQEQGKIIEHIRITPNETKAFFKKIPADSVPTIPMNYEIGQIVKKPTVGPTQLKEARDKIASLRERVLNGEKFSTMALLYSQDPGSASKGGELGFFGKGQMAPEFETASFGLKSKGDISEIIKTKFGYHLIQLIERRGDEVNARHILIIPAVSPDDLAAAATQLDSVSELIRMDSITFEKAALKYSDDPGKVNGGLMQSPSSGNTFIASDELDAKVLFVVDKLKPGEISGSVPFTTDDGTQAYRLLYLKSKTQPHKANLRDDYNRIQDWALEDKKQKAIGTWIAQKAKTAYVRIGDRFGGCDLEYEWLKKSN